MTQSSTITLDAPRFETGTRKSIAGFRESYAFSAHQFKQGIPAQWQRLGPMIGRIPGQIGAVCFDMFGDQASFDYIAGVEVAGTSALPDGFSQVRIPALTWAVFPHRLHASQFDQTMNAIMRDWLPTSGCDIAHGPGAPDLIERYGEDFDPQSGMGGMELWLPIRRRMT
jgi:AraC family transcriptional regulator